MRVVNHLESQHPPISCWARSSSRKPISGNSAQLLHRHTAMPAPSRAPDPELDSLVALDTASGHL